MIEKLDLVLNTSLNYKIVNKPTCIYDKITFFGLAAQSGSHPFMSEWEMKLVRPEQTVIEFFKLIQTLSGKVISF